MFESHTGDCEDCRRTFHYTLMQASLSDCSYAYCDSCGMLATINYSNSFLVNMPPISAPYQVIDAAWEPFLHPCECGGHFLTGVSPRCVFCNAILSANHAATYIERNFKGGGRGWRWQGNWTDLYCLAIEDPARPGALRHIAEPFIELNKPPENKPRKSRWQQILTFHR